MLVLSEKNKLTHRKIPARFLLLVTIPFLLALLPYGNVGAQTTTYTWGPIPAQNYTGIIESSSADENFARWYHPRPGEPSPGYSLFNVQDRNIEVNNCQPSRGRLVVGGETTSISIQGTAPSSVTNRCDDNGQPPDREEHDSERRIIVRMNFNNAEVSSVNSFGPIDAELRSSNGDLIRTVESNSVSPVLSSSLSLDATFDDVDAGNYQVCVPAMDNQCKTGEKRRFNALRLTFDGQPNDLAYVPIAGNEPFQCVNEGGIFGWVVCEILTWVLDRMVDVQQWIAEILFETKPLTIGALDDPLYLIWSNFRNLANILLIVAFMAVIFSLALSVNVDAYAVKRMVPRLLIAAVTIQASYFISAIFVDFTNILGGGLQSLTDIAMSDVRAEFGASQTAGGFLALGSLAALATAGILLVAAPSLGLLFLIFFLVLLGAFFIVAIRDLLIMMCVVLSPFAFLANLLPNTERWFKFWWSNFARLLLMYPFIILMIQMGNLGAYIMISTSRESDFLAPFMAIVMQIAAIASIYFAFRIGGSVLSVATQGLAKFSRGGGGGGKGGAQPKGVLGKIRANARDRKSEYRSGARGGTFTRAATNPTTMFGPLSRKTRSEAVSDFNRRTKEAEKQLEVEKIDDPNLLNDMAQSLGSTSQFRNHVRELRASGKGDRADQLVARASHLVGKKDFQAAALKRAASQGGRADNASFEAVAKTFSTSSPDLARQTVKDAAFEMGSKGRIEYRAATVDNRGNFVLPDATDNKQREALRLALINDPKSVTAESLEWYGRRGVLRSEVGDGTSTATAHALAGTMSGMNAKQRQEIANYVGEEAYENLKKQARSGAGGDTPSPPSTPKFGPPTPPPPGP